MNEQCADLFHSMQRINSTLNRQSALFSPATKDLEEIVTEVDAESQQTIERLLLLPGNERRNLRGV